MKRRPEYAVEPSVESWTTTGVPQPPNHVVEVSSDPALDDMTEPDGEEPVVIKGPAVPL